MGRPCTQRTPSWPAAAAECRQAACTSAAGGSLLQPASAAGPGCCLPQRAQAPSHRQQGSAAGAATRNRQHPAAPAPAAAGGCHRCQWRSTSCHQRLHCHRRCCRAEIANCPVQRHSTCPSLARTSAPAATSVCTAAVAAAALLLSMAQCSGSAPSSSLAHTSAPASAKVAMTLRTAAASGLSVTRFTSATLTLNSLSWGKKAQLGTSTVTHPHKFNTPPLCPACASGAGPCLWLVLLPACGCLGLHLPGAGAGFLSCRRGCAGSPLEAAPGRQRAVPARQGPGASPLLLPGGEGVAAA